MATAAFAGEEFTRSAYRIEHRIFGEIGSLTQEVHVNGANSHVETRVSIRVSLLRIPFFRMEAEWLEEWRNDELYRYSGTTVTNGDTERVAGQRYSDRFQIDTAEGTIQAPSEIQPVTPSSIRFVDGSFFMSPETGRVTRSRFVEGESPYIEFNDRLLKVRMFQAHMEGDHTVYFDGGGRLIRFEYADSTGNITVTRLPTADGPVLPEILSD